MSLLNEALCMSLCMSVSYKASQWQGHSKKKQSVQVVHVRRDAQENVTLRASPSSVQESTQEIPVVQNLETLGNCPFSCCARVDG